MKTEITKIGYGYDGKRCFVHARIGALNKNDLVLTTQYLNVFGDDDFSLLQVCRSHDGGKTWSTPKEDHAFFLPAENGVRWSGCDATSLFHKATGKLVTMGVVVPYRDGEVVPAHGMHHKPFYAVWNEGNGSFDTMRILDIPDAYGLYDALPGCTQFIEDVNGDLLVPMYIRRDGREYNEVAVFRCSFDGETVTVTDMGNVLTYKVERGLVEPSVILFNGTYYLTLRNDTIGMHAKSADGLHYTKPEIWTWDTGLPLPNYNTQQHWLTCGGKLYLVYTRKSGNNDHVFRHRAPLFMAQVDPETMTLLRHTEVIVAPERGARLGNFGVCQIDDDNAVISVTEWMQPLGCEKYGSDNSIWITFVSEE